MLAETLVKCFQDHGIQIQSLKCAGFTTFEILLRHFKLGICQGLQLGV